MPCYTVSTAKVKLNVKTVDQTLLKAAIDSLNTSLGRSMAYATDSTGTVSLVDYSGQRITPEIQSAVAKAYSTQVVAAQAKRFGWAVKTNPNGTITVQKARF